MDYHKQIELNKEIYNKVDITDLLDVDIEEIWNKLQEIRKYLNRYISFNLTKWYYINNYYLTFKILMDLDNLNNYKLILLEGKKENNKITENDNFIYVNKSRESLIDLIDTIIADPYFPYFWKTTRNIVNMTQLKL